MLWTRLNSFGRRIIRQSAAIFQSSESGHRIAAATEAIPETSDHRVWCVVANIVSEHAFGESHELRRGTKHFPPGAKVYCYPPLWGDGYEKVKVIGHHRGSHRLVTMVVPSKWLENWRVKMVYSPFVVNRMRPHWDDSDESQRRATTLVESCLKRPE